MSQVETADLIPSSITDKWVSCSLGICYLYICLSVNQNANVSPLQKGGVLNNDYKIVLSSFTCGSSVDKVCSCMVIGICRRWHLGIVLCLVFSGCLGKAFPLADFKLQFVQGADCVDFFPKCFRECTGKPVNMGCGTLEDHVITVKHSTGKLEGPQTCPGSCTVSLCCSALLWNRTHRFKTIFVLGKIQTWRYSVSSWQVSAYTNIFFQSFQVKLANSAKVQFWQYNCLYNGSFCCQAEITSLMMITMLADAAITDRINCIHCEVLWQA